MRDKYTIIFTRWYSICCIRETIANLLTFLASLLGMFLAQLPATWEERAAALQCLSFFVTVTHIERV
jgi:hypothetical protein